MCVATRVCDIEATRANLCIIPSTSNTPSLIRKGAPNRFECMLPLLSNNGAHKPISTTTPSTPPMTKFYREGNVKWVKCI